ncbi:hypothetical protein [Novipirellula rosea]|uniref:Prenyltransferase and squalene oxidase repeat protein n=1 Tax=Novipirellula rosea TaxID=1031540 RepID=A0ABP8MRV8_9BACT
MTGRWKFHRGRRIFVAAIAVGMTCFPAVAEESKKPSESESLRQEIVSNGLAFLAKMGQSDAGTFSDKVGPGVTALAITAALRNGRGTDDPMVAEGLKALEGYVKPDGGIYGNGRLRNYEMTRIWRPVLR